MHTGSRRGCSCDCRTIPLCCGFQLLDRRRQRYSVQKPLTITAAASVYQKRTGGTKTSYIRCQRTSHQQKGEFSAFLELFPLSCIPPSVQGTQPLSEAGLIMCSFPPASVPQESEMVFLTGLLVPSTWAAPHAPAAEAPGRMEKRLPAETSAPLLFGQKTLARSVLILNCDHSGQTPARASTRVSQGAGPAG